MATTGIQIKELKGGKKSYAVWYKKPGSNKQYHYKSFRLKKIAEQEKQKLAILLDTGEIPRISLKKRNTMAKIGDVAAQLQEDWMRRLDTKKLSKSTVANYLIHKKMLEKEFSRLFLGELKEVDILNYQAKMAREISNATSNRRLFVLKQIIAFAVSNGYMTHDVAKNVRYLSEKEHERTNSLSSCALMDLLKIAGLARSKNYMVLAILLAAEHGAAKQEILSLQWDDIDFEFDGLGWIHFFRLKNEVKRLHPLKMHRTRDALLQRRKYLANFRHINENQVQGYVICHPDGTPIGDIKTAWGNIREAAGLGDYHFHDLRHTFCSNLLRSGASLKMVKEYIGHKTLRMTDRYTHLESYQELAGFERLDNLYAS